MSLTRENLFELLKANIMALSEKAEALATNPQLQKAWKKESDLISEQMSKLPADDLKWVNDNYKEWAEENLSPARNHLLNKDLGKEKPE